MKQRWVLSQRQLASWQGKAAQDHHAKFAFQFAAKRGGEIIMACRIFDEGTGSVDDLLVEIVEDIDRGAADGQPVDRHTREVEMGIGRAGGKPSLLAPSPEISMVRNRQSGAAAKRWAAKPSA